MFKLNKITQSSLIIYTIIFIVLIDNTSFFKNVIDVYPISFTNILFLFSLSILLICLSIILFTMISSKYTIKPFLILILIISSFINYFTNTYNIIIDESMIRNSLQTDLHESLDLFSFKLLIYFFLLGVLPSVLIYKINIEYKTFKYELISKLKVIVVCIVIIVVILLSFSKFYTSFFREHKPLRYYANPLYAFYSSVKYINHTFYTSEPTFNHIGKDAIIDTKSKVNKIVIMVVGEAARSDRFSLNGYSKKTNPLLENMDIVNFPNFYSCGTSTAVSVPCMFSLFDRDNFTYKKGIYTDNVLDVLNHTGKVAILWRDNNSDSKGVAVRLAYENYKTPENNTISDIEPRDMGMLVGLDKYILKNKGKDILIVLHQMGNHGPAYFKRYPEEYKIFTPVCKTNQLEECSTNEISNAYDNAILYTDYFLASTINMLKKYNTSHETAMIYMSDHGESLGENGLYLHGLPYFIAPDTQTHIGALMWFGDKMKKKINKKINNNIKYSHDNLFHTLLGIFDTKTVVYDKEMDILQKESN